MCACEHTWRAQHIRKHKRQCLLKVITHCRRWWYTHTHTRADQLSYDVSFARWRWCALSTTHTHVSTLFRQSASDYMLRSCRMAAAKETVQVERGKLMVRLRHVPRTLEHRWIIFVIQTVARLEDEQRQRIHICCDNWRYRSGIRLWYLIEIRYEITGISAVIRIFTRMDVIRSKWIRIK